MSYDYFVSFTSKSNGWMTNQSMDDLVLAQELRKNVTNVVYSNGVDLMQISLPHRVWHVYCNYPLKLEPTLDPQSLKDSIDFLVTVIVK